MKVKCKFCAEENLPLQIIDHMKKKHETLATECKEFNCIVDGNCKGKFAELKTLRRHIVTSHANILTTSTQTSSTSNEVPMEVDIPQFDEEEFPTAQQDQEKEDITFKTIENLLEDFFLSFTLFGLPDVQQDIVQSKLLELHSSIFEFSKKHMDAPIDAERITDIFGQVNAVEKGYSSKEKRTKHFQTLKFFVEPKEVSLGTTRTEKWWNNFEQIYEDKIVDCSFQYVPITTTIKTLFKCPIFR